MAETQSHESGWAPLRSPDFRRLWTAQFISNIGGWMQTVAAQWVMISLTGSAILVGAVSAAGSLPVLLLGVPAGVLGDLVDRRRLIVAAQAVMLAAAAALAVFSAAGLLTPLLLLALLFALGCGQAASAPTWQTLQPELAPADERSEAIALGSVNQNLARAIGPAIGGALLAAASAALVFGLNALSFVAVLVAILITRIPARVASVPREHALDATRAGGRFVLHSPALVSLIVRAGLFIFPAGAIWALLPLVAHGKLGLGSAGYGVLLGCVGVGALAAATFGPAVRKRLSPRSVYALCAAVVAGAAVVLAYSTSSVVDGVVLVIAGAAWIVCLGLLGAAYQSEMPAWVKARGMSYYLVSFQGAAAIGGLAFSTVAQAAALDDALLAVAAALLVALVLTWRLSLPKPAPDDFRLVDPWPLPELAPDAEPASPVLVTVRWPVRHDALPEFFKLAPELQRLRRRTGAVSWRVYRDAEDTDVLVETFVVGTWEEHERQHGRVDARDARTLDALDATLRTGERRTVTHSIGLTALWSGHAAR